MAIDSPGWVKILHDIAEDAEKAYLKKGAQFQVALEETVVNEITARINDAMKYFKKPNAAKIAGVVAFWIRKLKPLYIPPDSKETFRLINELVALKVGLAICNKYMVDPEGRPVELRLNARIVRDWIASLRYHSHSPHSSVISFEMLACNDAPFHDDQWGTP